MESITNEVSNNDINMSAEEDQNKNSCNVLHEIQNLNKNKLMNKATSSQQFQEYEYWPEDNNATKKRKVKSDKEKVPKILSSTEARTFFTNKREKKENEEKEKELRKLEREEKSRLNKELKERKADERRKRNEEAAKNRIKKVPKPKKSKKQPLIDKDSLQ